MSIYPALVSVVTAALLAWLVGTRVSYLWDEVKRQRESDLAALEAFYDAYGGFFAAWKSWAVFNALPRREDSFPASDPMAWEILSRAGKAESGFESILVKLASEYAHTDDECRLYAAFRQATQSLREAIRNGKNLEWKAQPLTTANANRIDAKRPDDSLIDEERLNQYRRYRAFKALCEYVAVTLARGPHIKGQRRPRRPFTPLKRVLRIDRHTAAANLIAMTQVLE